MHQIFCEKIEKILSLKQNTLESLKRLKLFLVKDILLYKPSYYSIYHLDRVDNSLINSLVQLKVKILSFSEKKSTNRKITLIKCSFKGHLITLVFFYNIPKFLFQLLKTNSECIISGKLLYDDQYQIIHPEVILNKKLYKEIIPTYPLTYSITNTQIYNYILKIIEICEIKFTENIQNPNTQIDDFLVKIMDWIKKLHFVEKNISSNQAVEEYLDAINKLKYEELYSHQCSIIKMNREIQKSYKHEKIYRNTKMQKDTLENLNFTLTKSQVKALNEIEQDQLNPNFQMMRLLQGDVGTGKTLVALLSMINVICSDMQAVLMAPTELLAQQHYNFFVRAFSKSDLKIALLTGSSKLKESSKIKAELLKEKGIQILIGTHSLFQKGIEFYHLKYIVIDEQHKFGVKQRLDLIKKAKSPDVLIMTATPIPRSLTLTMFGQISVSQLKDNPKERKKIETISLSLKSKTRIIESLKNQISLNHKVYWVCPLIKREKLKKNSKKNSLIDLGCVEERYKELEGFYPGMVLMLHGDMRQTEKDNVMRKFLHEKYMVLVSTTVIEVGIDIPLSSVIVIENAERFGLSQLHQLRGRVGRDDTKSYCVMLYEDRCLSKIVRKRLQIMKKSNDGFFIAEQDLVLRGQGDLLGIKQSGEIDFLFSDITRDQKILLLANQEAQKTQFSELTNFQIKLFTNSSAENLKGL